MKAGPFVPEHVRYPLIVQPKYDGWRCVVDDGVSLTATLKPIPNFYVRDYFAAAPLAQCLDGELTIGPPTDPTCFNRVDTLLKRFHGEPDFVYYVFDFQTDGHMPFRERFLHATFLVERLNDPRVRISPCWTVCNEAELMSAEESLVTEGYEGVIVRDPDGLYKQRRSTSREGWCIKIKRFQDSEAKIIGFEELRSNQNEKTVDERGLTKRASLSANMVPMDTLGAFLSQDIYSGQVFRVGSFRGLDLPARKDIWDHRDEHLGRVFTYKFQLTGGYELPRIPIWKGWRNDL
jgi:DNA ligase-1